MNEIVKRGLGGWLILVGILLVWSIPTYIFSLLLMGGLLSFPPELEIALGIPKDLLKINIVVDCIFLALYCRATYLFFKKANTFPEFFCTLVAFNSCWIYLCIFLYFMSHTANFETIIFYGTFGSFVTIQLFIIIFYMNNSKRVKETFIWSLTADKKTVAEGPIYEQVAHELSTNDRNEGLWLKAQTKSEGGEAKTKAYYTKMRVEQIKNIEEGKIVQEQQELMKGVVTKIDNKDRADNMEEVDVVEEIDAEGNEHIYEQIAKEFSTDTVRQGLWLKLETKTGGNEAKTKALYIKMRVSQIKKAEQERIEQEKLEQERLEQEEQEKLEQERIDQEKLEQERIEQEKLEQERLEQERKKEKRRKRKEAIIFILSIAAIAVTTVAKFTIKITKKAIIKFSNIKFKNKKNKKL